MQLQNDLNKLELLLRSRKFWAFVAGIFGIFVSNFPGLLPSNVVGFVDGSIALITSSFIIGTGIEDAGKGAGDTTINLPTVPVKDLTPPVPPPG